MENFFKIRSKIFGIKIHFIPYLLLAFVIVLEVATPNIRVAPSLLTITIAFMAFTLPPRTIAMWTVFLLPLLIVSLSNSMFGGTPEPPILICLRCTAFLVIGGMATSLGFYREQLVKDSAQLITIFNSLRTPIVVSDVDGTIRYVNNACCDLIGRKQSEVKDFNYFSLFSNPEQKGRTIQKYIALFDTDTPGTDRSSVMTITKIGIPIEVEAHYRTITFGLGRLLLTQFTIPGP